MQKQEELSWVEESSCSGDVPSGWGVQQERTSSGENDPRGFSTSEIPSATLQVVYPQQHKFLG